MRKPISCPRCWQKQPLADYRPDAEIICPVCGTRFMPPAVTLIPDGENPHSQLGKVPEHTGTLSTEVPLDSGFDLVRPSTVTGRVPLSPAEAVATPVVPPGFRVGRRTKKPLTIGRLGMLVIGLAVGTVVCGLTYFFVQGIVAKALWPTPEWLTFTPPLGQFTVQVPGNPRSADINRNGVHVTHYVVQLDKGRTIYEVGYFDLPNNKNFFPLVWDDYDKFVTAYRKTLIDLTGGQIQAERNLKANGLDWQEFKIDVTGSSTLVVRTTLVQIGKVYRVFILTAQGRHFSPDQGDGARFLNSFSFVQEVGGSG